jgi:hypothetical protein
MKTALFRVIGAFTGVESFASRDQFHLPNRVYPPVTGGTGTGGIFPSIAPRVFAILPTGSTATFRVQGTGQSAFIRWEGPCVNGTGGTSQTCTLPVGAAQAPVATAYLEYFRCANGSLTDVPAPNCTKVQP